MAQAMPFSFSCDPAFASGRILFAIVISHWLWFNAPMQLDHILFSTDMSSLDHIQSRLKRRRADCPEASQANALIPSCLCKTMCEPCISSHVQASASACSAQEFCPHSSTVWPPRDVFSAPAEQKNIQDSVPLERASLPCRYISGNGCKRMVTSPGCVVPCLA